MPALPESRSTDATSSPIDAISPVHIPLMQNETTSDTMIQNYAKNHKALRPVVVEIDAHVCGSSVRCRLTAAAVALCCACEAVAPPARAAALALAAACDAMSPDCAAAKLAIRSAATGHDIPANAMSFATSLNKH